VGTSRRYDNRLGQWLLANPWQVGRSQVAREYSSGHFDALLTRIGSDSLYWGANEAQPGPGWPFEDDQEAQKAEERFRRGSWYFSNALETASPTKPNGFR